jgi:hypothetical protein
LGARLNAQVWLDRLRRLASKKRSGSARSKIGDNWIHHVKECSKAFHWVVIWLWLIKPAGCSATASHDWPVSDGIR